MHVIKCYFGGKHFKLENLSISFQRLSSITELSEAQQELIRAAQSASDTAYAPYSKFKVGAALRLDDGTVVEGSNQENKAFPSGLCAERVALFYAGSQFKGRTIESIAVVGSGDLIAENQFVSPCGSCRQVLLESAERQTDPIELLMLNRLGEVMAISDVKDLLPFAFGLQQ